MKLRLWYPQLDVYDAIRRMGLLLGLCQNSSPLSLERLYIADFYFANSALIHNTNMPKSVRDEFRLLKIPRPENSFISLPAASLLFRQMEVVQREAIRNMTGKGLVERQAIEAGTAILSDRGLRLYLDHLVELMSADEKPVMDFLVTHFVLIDSSEIDAFRRRTGLRRVVL